MIHFTSDPHYYHRNVIRYCNRPFADLDEMHASLIANWNSVVAPEDTVYMVGDYCFGNVTKGKVILDQLNGTKHLARGNHDHSIAKCLNMGFATVERFYKLKIKDRDFNVCHYPYRDTRYPDRAVTDDGSFLIHGHIHNEWRIRDNQFNAGVDVNNFRPVSELEVYDLLCPSSDKP